MSQFIEMFGNPLDKEQKYPSKKLSECCVINPQRPSFDFSESDNVSFVPMPSVSENGHLQDVAQEEFGKVKKGFTCFTNNDVLFAKITPCMENGKGAIAQNLINNVGMGSTEFHVLRPIEGISNPYWILTLTRLPLFRTEAAKNMTGTGGQKRVPSQFLSNFKVGLPPIEEQNELEEICKQADKSEFDEFKSQFIEMFGNPLTNDKNWAKYVLLKDASDIVLGSTPNSKEPSYWDGNCLWITPAEMSEESFYISDTTRHITEKGRNAANLTIMPVGTVLFSTRAPIGKIGIVSKPMCCNQGFKNFIPGDDLNSVFLYYTLIYNRTYLQSLGIGTTFKELSKKAIESLSIAIPSMELQNKFEMILNQADKSESVCLSLISIINKGLDELSVMKWAS